MAVARFGWHKERALRLVGDLCGSRFGRGVVVPGGVRALPRLGAADTRRRVDELDSRLRSDVRPSWPHRPFWTDCVTPDPWIRRLAERRGALGPVGRASGCPDDDRWDRSYDAYDRFERRPPAARPTGDALARLRVRWDEVDEAFHLSARRSACSPKLTRARAAVPIPAVTGRAVGWAEAPQGEVLYVVTARDGRLTRCAPRSASFQNLALFSATFTGDILTDFPFDEASFGVSIAGVVL